MSFLIRSIASSLALVTILSSLARAEDPPKTWVDKDTGHRVWRISDEPNSGGFYFNVNAYTPDHKQMIYTAPDGIHVLDMATRKTRLLVPNPPAATAAESGDPSAVRGAGASRNPHALVAGSKTNSVFFTQRDPATNSAAVYKADTNTGAIRKLTDLRAQNQASSASTRTKPLPPELTLKATPPARSTAPTSQHPQPIPLTIALPAPLRALTTSPTIRDR